MSEEYTTNDSNPKFELKVLGAALTNEDSWDTISRRLREIDFATSEHRHLFDEIVRADEQGYRTDEALVAQALVNNGNPEGYSLIAAAITSAAPHPTLTFYIDALRAHSRARISASLGYELQRAAAAVGGDSEALSRVLADHEDALRAIEDDDAEEPWSFAEELLRDVSQGSARLEATVPTGFYDLDKKLTGGFRPGQMVVLAGRPAMGKTTIAMDICRNASLHHMIPGLFISLEMSKEEIAMRIASAETSIPLTKFLSNELTAEQRSKVSDTATSLADSPLLIVDSTESTWPSIRSLIATAKHRYGIQYVVLDYLQLATDESSNRSDNRQNEVSRMSRGAKTLARVHDLTFFAVSQLNRGTESRSGNQPQMSDLRESGSIEQDADVIGLLHRPDYYDPESVRAGEADLILAKQRNGATGTVSLAFQGHYSRFVSMAQDANTWSGADAYPRP